MRDGIDETGALDLLELSMTENPASLCLPPLTVLDGDLTNRYAADRVIEQAPNLRSRDLLQRAQVEHRVRDGRTILHVENRSGAPGRSSRTTARTRRRSRSRVSRSLAPAAPSSRCSDLRRRYVVLVMPEPPAVASPRDAAR